MSEPANTSSTATATPVTSDCKAASCAAAPKPSQPQTTGAPANPQAAQKGFKRQNRKQH